MHCHLASANNLLNPKWSQEIDERGNFLFGTGNLNNVGTGVNVNHLSAEDIDDVQQFSTATFINGNFNQCHLALNRGGILEVDDFDDTDQLVELLGDLLNDLIITAR